MQNNVMQGTANTTSVFNATTDDTFQPDDATWILTSAFIIFTMQSGFGLLEAGLVSRKNETNIMVKNAIDVIYGGLAYWIFGFAISFGEDAPSNMFTGWGHFFVDSDERNMGLFAKYFFQLSFATTATTIVSGAMAERVDLKAYIAFSFFNTLSYAFPAHWMWDDKGFLNEMGAVDVAGCGPVHLVGGVAGIVAAVMLKPRKSKFDVNGKPRDMPMASPTNVLLGTFMLWWGWLGFNCGSTFGTSGDKWKIASRAAVVTINGSIGGGIFGMIYSYTVHKKKLLINIFVTGILGGLVSVTAICAVCRPWEALVIGIIGGAVATGGLVLEERLLIDDPVGAFPTHALASIWGLIATALFCEPTGVFADKYGVLKGGSWKFMGVQLLACFCCSVWSAATTFIQLYIIDKLIGLRMTDEEEELGADYYVHNINPYEAYSRSSTHVNPAENDRNANASTERNSDMPNDSQTAKNRVVQRQSFEMETSSNINTNKFREIGARRSPGKIKVRNNAVSSSFNGAESSLKSMSRFDQHIVIVQKGTINTGYHSN